MWGIHKVTDPHAAQNQPDEEESLDLYEINTHPFIIQIWLEVSAKEDRPAVWRGHITHVPSNTRRHFQDIKEIIRFIVPYMEEMGIDVDLPWPVDNG